MQTIVRFFFLEGIVRSWWVWTFALICAGVYESANHFLREVERDLRWESAECDKLLHVEATEQTKLETLLAHQNDPQTVELMLMRVMGVVPVGQTKVYIP